MLPVSLVQPVVVKNTFLEIDDNCLTRTSRRCKTEGAIYAESPVVDPDQDGNVGATATASPGPSSQVTSKRIGKFAGRVCTLAKESRGCRELQEALEDAAREEELLTLAAELHGHVWELMTCPNANYVLQKVICLASPQGVKFIIDEIAQKGTDAICKAARHRFACRIIQRLLEHCVPDQVKELKDVLIADLVNLSRHPYGNFVVQDILEQGTEEEQLTIFVQLEKHIATLGVHEYACSVIGKAMSCGKEEQQQLLAQAIAKRSGLLSSMFRSRHNYCVAKRVLLKLGTEAKYHHTLKDNSSFIKKMPTDRRVQLKCVRTQGAVRSLAAMVS